MAPYGWFGAQSKRAKKGVSYSTLQDEKTNSGPFLPEMCFPRFYRFCEFCIKGWRFDVTIMNSGKINRELLAFKCLQQSEENLEEDLGAGNK